MTLYRFHCSCCCHCCSYYY